MPLRKGEGGRGGRGGLLFQVVLWRRRKHGQEDGQEVLNLPSTSSTALLQSSCILFISVLGFFFAAIKEASAASTSVLRMF